jgi:hypothetical protein
LDPLDRLAQALGMEPTTAEETTAILTVARDVAHTIERRITPVSTFLLGMSVQERVAGGTTRQDALASALSDLRAAMPSDPTAEASEPAE